MGLEKTPEVLFYATLQYVYDWCGKVKEDISETLASLYEDLREHAEEVSQFARIRGMAIEILRYMDDVLKYTQQDGI